MLAAFPSCLRLVATTRKQGGVLAMGQFALADCCLIDAHSAENTADLIAYISNRVASTEVLAAGAIAANVVGKEADGDEDFSGVADWLARKCNGNFVVAACILDDIADGRLKFTEIDKSCKLFSLNGVYEESFRRRFPLDGVDQQQQWRIAQTVLAILMAEPVNRSQLHHLLRVQFTSLSDIRLPAQLLGYVVELSDNVFEEPTLTLHHQSITDWLCRPSETDDESPYRVDKAQGHRLHAAWFFLRVLASQAQTLTTNPDFLRCLCTWLQLDSAAAAGSLASLLLKVPRFSSVIMAILDSNFPQHCLEAGAAGPQFASLVTGCRLFQWLLGKTLRHDHVLENWIAKCPTLLASFLDCTEVEVDRREAVILDIMRRAVKSDGAQFLPILFVDDGRHVAKRTAEKALGSVWVYRNTDLVRRLCALDVDVNLESAAMAKRTKPILAAAQLGNLEAVRLLLKHNARLDVTDRIGATVLHMASRCGSIELVRFLVENCKVDVQQCDSHGLPPLFDATMSRSLPLVRYLIESKARTDVTDAFGNTPVHFACARARSASVDMIKFFVSLGVAADVANKAGYTPAMVAAPSHPDICKYLIGECHARTEVFNMVDLKLGSDYSLEPYTQIASDRDSATVCSFSLSGQIFAIIDVRHWFVCVLQSCCFRCMTAKRATSSIRSCAAVHVR